MRAVTFFDGTALREGLLSWAPGRGPVVVDAPAPAGTPRLDGVITGRFTDHHVHLQLVDHTRLAASRLGRVTDLGADLDWIRAVAQRPGVHNSGEFGAKRPETPADGRNRPDVPEKRTPQVEYAGPFLTAVGGYPSDREWAPAGSVREIADADDAATVVAALASAGAACVKVVANSDAGPVLGDDLFRAIAQHAAARGLPLVAHAEGAGQAMRAIRLGAARLAHAPFTERLTDDEIAEQAATAEWISTMAVHDGDAYQNVVDNVRRFHAAGGRVLYGTDMGNGPTPVDVRNSEIAALRAAGIDGADLLCTMAPEDPRDAASALLLLPDGDPSRSRPLTPEDLTSDDRTPTTPKTPKTPKTPTEP